MKGSYIQWLQKQKGRPLTGPALYVRAMEAPIYSVPAPLQKRRYYWGYCRYCRILLAPCVFFYSNCI